MKMFVMETHYVSQFFITKFGKRNDQRFSYSNNGLNSGKGLERMRSKQLSLAHSHGR